MFHRFSPIARVGLVVGGLIMAAVFAFGFGALVMVLWNWLMPEIFGLPQLSYWQGWGLVLLAHILIKAGGGPSGAKSHRDGNWKRRFWDRMRQEMPSREEDPPEDVL